MFSNFFLNRKSCPLWDNVEKYWTAGQATENNMAHAHFMLDTYGYKHTSEYVILSAFPLQQLLHERASVLRYTYIACLVCLGALLILLLCVKYLPLLYQCSHLIGLIILQLYFCLNCWIRIWLIACVSCNNIYKPAFLDSWNLKMGPIGCPETSVRNYYYLLCNSPEERSSHLLRCGSLKSPSSIYFVVISSAILIISALHVA